MAVGGKSRQMAVGSRQRKDRKQGKKEGRKSRQRKDSRRGKTVGRWQYAGKVGR